MDKMMTPGPTQVRDNVRLARAMETTNPDLDLGFYEYYKKTCNKLAQFFHSQNPFYLLSGEGILGLEAACASLTVPGRRVLVIENGVFGKGFADFVKIYGGIPVTYSSDWKRPVAIEVLKEFLENDHDFDYATVVHCDTPSGILNDVEEICALLADYGILSVVDTVAASFGTPLEMDKGCIDILCGGSQKALSAPTGLTFLGVSSRAMQFMESRKTPIASFYMNILQYKNYYKDKWFPYTMPISDIYGFGTALDNILKEGDKIFERHSRIAAATRRAVEKAGLSLYLEYGYSPTVTAVCVPEGIQDTEIIQCMKERYHIIIAGSFAEMAGKVIRLGHMGENANIRDMWMLMSGLSGVFAHLGRHVSCDMGEAFLCAWEEG